MSAEFDKVEGNSDALASVCAGEYNGVALNCGIWAALAAVWPMVEGFWAALAAVCPMKKGFWAAYAAVCPKVGGIWAALAAIWPFSVWAALAAIGLMYEGN